MHQSKLRTALWFSDPYSLLLLLLLSSPKSKVWVFWKVESCISSHCLLESWVVIWTKMCTVPPHKLSVNPRPWIEHGLIFPVRGLCSNLRASSPVLSIIKPCSTYKEGYNMQLNQAVSHTVAAMRVSPPIWGARNTTSAEILQMWNAKTFKLRGEQKIPCLHCNMLIKRDHCT